MSRYAARSLVVVLAELEVARLRTQERGARSAPRRAPISGLLWPPSINRAAGHPPTPLAGLRGRARRGRQLPGLSRRAGGPKRRPPGARPILAHAPSLPALLLTAAPSLPPTPGLRRAAHLLGRALRERALQLSARNQHDCGKQAKAGHAVGGVQLNRVLRSARGGARRCAPRRRLHVGLRRRGAAAPIVAMALAPGADDRNQEATCYVGDLDQQISESLLWELCVQVPAQEPPTQPRCGGHSPSRSLAAVWAGGERAHPQG